MRVCVCMNVYLHMNAGLRMMNACVHVYEYVCMTACVRMNVCVREYECVRACV